MGLSIWELMIILVIVAILFGTKKLRSIGGDLGNAVKGFRSAIKDDDDAENGADKNRNVDESVIDSSTGSDGGEDTDKSRNDQN